MTKKLLALAVALATATTIALVGVADAATRAPTTVTIQGTNGEYNGTVSSTKPALCANNRKVVVFKQLGGSQSPSTDQKIGSDTASKNGSVFQWNIGNSGFKHGQFYARAKGTPDCKPDSSPTITR